MHTRVILELDLAATPVAGSVIDSLGHEHPFAGWMALTRTIELALVAARQDALQSPGSTATSKSAP
jgi:hypothetical protein